MSIDSRLGPLPDPDTSRKLRALESAINFKRMHLARLRVGAVDYETVRGELEALEAIRRDYSSPAARSERAVG